LGRLRRFEAFCGLPDQRDARGLRYTLVTVLVFVVLAKLAGENHPRGIAQWVKWRAVLLATFLALAAPQAPHATTFSRILGKAVAIEEFDKSRGTSLPGHRKREPASSSRWTEKRCAARFPLGRRRASIGSLPFCPTKAGC
jgi:hypothetical protein